MDKKSFLQKKDEIKVHLFRIKQENQRNIVFCIFEGEDNDYYSPILNTHNNSFNFIIRYIHAGNKKNVLEIYNKTHKLKDLNILYFIDRDFDANNKIDSNDDIYITKGYSIENYYTQVNVFEKICNNFLYYCDEKIISNYIERKKEFHDIFQVINKTLKYCRLNDISLKSELFETFDKILSIEYNSVSVKSGINVQDYINNISGYKFNFSEIDKKISFKDQDYDFRGKYEIKFFYEFLLLTKKYILDNNLKRCKSSIKGLDNFKILLKIFTPYAEQPECLINYIKNRFSSFYVSL